MKISKRLRATIGQIIRDNFREVMIKTEAKFRADEISHDTWKDIYSSLINQREKTETKVLEEIQFYRKRR